MPSVRLPSHNELLPWIERMKTRHGGLQVVGTSAKAAVPIDAADFKGPIVLVTGNETHGLSEAYRNLCDQMVTIPMSGSASSLNLAIATSIILYEVDRQRRGGR